MHPCRTALIGLLCLCVATAHNNCDQHASQQATYESANYIAAPSNQFTGYAAKTETRGSGVFGSGGGTYQEQGIQNSNPSGNAPFWWMNSNASPFKAQGCDSANGCTGQTNTVQLEKDGYAKMDLSKNIFINKNFGALGASSNQKTVNVAATNSLIGAGGSVPSGFTVQKSEFSHSTGSGFNNAGNPFLNKAAGGSANQYQTGYTQTTGAATNNVNSYQSSSQSGFGQTGAAYQNGGSSFGSNSVSNGYGEVNADRGYLPPKETVTCSGPGKICASKQICVNGYVYDNLVGSSNGVSHLFIQIM